MKQIEEMTGDEFRKYYNSQHKYCPNCGSEHCAQTMASYVLNMSNPTDYRNKNHCYCICEFAHTAHDRVATKPIKK